MTLHDALKAIVRYARHTDDCDVHHGSNCTCGKDETVATAKSQLGRLDKHNRGT